MRWLTVLALYQVVYGRFQFLDSRSSQLQDQQQLDSFANDLFANFMHDMNLDISFDRQSSPFIQQQQSPFINDFFSNDQSPSSMFGPSMFPFSPRSSSPKPLYLMVQSFKPKQPSSMFILEESHKVNGNTYRYSVKTNGNNKFITESWSSSPTKMYLCNSASCGSQNGMEMMSILDNLLDAADGGPKYMHLVPTSTMQPMIMEDEEDDDIKMNIDDVSPYDFFPQSLMDLFGGMTDKVKGCHDKMKQMMSMSSSEEEEINANQYEKLEHMQCIGINGYGADLVRDYEGTAEECQALCDTFDNCAGFVRVNGPSTSPYAGLCYLRADGLQTPYSYTNDDRDCYVKLEQTDMENIPMDFIGNDMVLADETDSTSLAAHENDNLLLVVMGVIMILVMICGVCYAGRRFLMDRKERYRMDSYTSMDENDKF